jgi:hypothetical protein
MGERGVPKMLTRNLRKGSIALLAVAAMLLSAVPAFAHDGPHHTDAPAGAWKEIAPGESQWHAFRSEGEGDQIDVLLRLGDEGNGIGGLGFKVFTPFQIQEWMKGEADVAPIGRGAEDEFVAADLSWKGSFVNSGTYFVVVENTAATPNSYSLTATGDDIWFEIAPAATMEAMGADMPPTGVVMAMSGMDMLAPAGTGPAEALHVSNDWKELAPGSELWFAFRSRGEGDNILAELHLGPEDDRTGFTIYTPEQIRAWQDGDDLKAIGGGSENAFLEADLAWQGNFNVPETYFLRVENAGSLPSYFSLRITGDDLG